VAELQGGSACIAGSYQRFEDRLADARRKARAIRETTRVALAITPWTSLLLLRYLKSAAALSACCTAALDRLREDPASA
jgi:acyl-CoA reductase-like NAD-dependent aldehyde dehydrogenase